MNDTNFNKISKIISKHTKVKLELINFETSAETIERWDSLAHINIIVDIEREFNIKIKTAKVGELNSVKNISQFLNK
jgi:acyl carrier protein|tara:strand:+ start:261 stop:491 length:231 start_codon:yes stop_codon:yes gene_type:complete